jgi:hypothetical protein
LRRKHYYPYSQPRLGIPFLAQRFKEYCGRDLTNFRKRRLQSFKEEHCNHTVELLYLVFRETQSLEVTVDSNWKRGTTEKA